MKTGFFTGGILTFIFGALLLWWEIIEYKRLDRTKDDIDENEDIETSDARWNYSKSLNLQGFMFSIFLLAVATALIINAYL